MIKPNYAVCYNERNVAKMLERAWKEKNYGATYCETITYNDGNEWAAVAAWLLSDDCDPADCSECPYYNEDEECEGRYELYAKLAYCPENSMMNEYNFDWMMPSYDDGDVSDSEDYVASGDDEFNEEGVKSTAKYLGHMWRDFYVNFLVDEEDEDAWPDFDEDEDDEETD